MVIHCSLLPMQRSSHGSSLNIHMYCMLTQVYPEWSFILQGQLGLSTTTECDSLQIIANSRGVTPDTSSMFPFPHAPSHQFGPLVVVSLCHLFSKIGQISTKNIILLLPDDAVLPLTSVLDCTCSAKNI